MTVVDSNGKTFDSLEEMLEDYERHMTAWQRAERFIWRRAINPIRDARYAVKYACQRVTRGWDDMELWHAGDSLCGRLGRQLVVLSEISNGSPQHYPHDQWTADLKEHGEALLAYHANRYDVAEDELSSLYAAAQDALRWSADNLMHLWD